MQRKLSRNGKLKTNSFERQNRAIVNLQQLSEYTWQPQYQNNNTMQRPIIQQKLNSNTHQSTELPLNPKQKHYESPLRSKIKSISLDKPRPNTIQHRSNRPEQSFDGLKNNKIQPLTLLNFYDDVKRSFNTFDDRSRLNEKFEMFASRIRQQGKFFNSTELTKTRTSGLKQPNNSTSLSFKKSIAKKSFFYKQFKNFLYQSFKIDGKPVQIRRDKYSIESHGLPKKKSIYSFRENDEGDFFAFNKTDVLRKKAAGRYDIQENEQVKVKELVDSRTRKKRSLYEDGWLQVNRSLHAREREKDGRKRQKGKIIRGRPPSTLLFNQD